MREKTGSIAVFVGEADSGTARSKATIDDSSYSTFWKCAFIVAWQYIARMKAIDKIVEDSVLPCVNWIRLTINLKEDFEDQARLVSCNRKSTLHLEQSEQSELSHG